MDIQNLLEEIAGTVRPVAAAGEVANYIPGLSSVSADHFGICVATADGEIYGAGEWASKFSIQSISKVFSLALVLAGDGDRIWQRVFREPSGTPFNSLVQLESEEGIPRNPFINAGALVVTDRLITLTGDAGAAVRDLLRRESGNPEVAVDPLVAASEAEYGHRNSSLAHLLASYGNLENSVDLVLEQYFDQCALEMSCRDLAVGARFLSRNGVAADGSQFLSPSQTKRINAVMLTCGTYDAAGEFAYRVGLPGKSGVGGGIVAVVPGRCTICVWSPGLSKSGNSLAGMAALDEFTTRTGWSIF
ncbi:glutaminase [Arthrobacter sp. H14-L1]|uniref:glutaminase n=1 Tax=Arthrobacter sp. H14-L1 TaxID=2996697 RepID=UPI00226D951E|nr:glutaminase [Arthrobacter sp. H14-L1]MCY0904265.1 glutaminase [Arthrobacter sp. H14-L1]